MTAKFDYFVLFAEMRTGSNYLESNLNEFPGIVCHGEAFNPTFIGYPNRSEVLGVSLDARDEDPERLLSTIRDFSEGLGGFRFFHDHDPRVVDQILQDPRCAKIILTRNPAESYVSWKIARATGQWKLTDVRKRKDSRILFEEQEFTDHMQALQDFQVRILNTLQKTGQTAFYIDYEDLNDLDVVNGLARFLGVDAQLDKLSEKLKKQNPEALEDKVENFDRMNAALAKMDRFNLSRTPNFEPRRGPNVPSFVAAQGAPLLFMPVKGAPTNAVTDWLTQLGDTPGVLQDFSQKTLRQWKRQNPGHRSFTVVRHPVARAHEVFCRCILSDEEGSFPRIRRALTKRYKLPLPPSVEDLAYDVEAHRQAFLGFLDWLQGNLAEQTTIRVDANWASQSQIIQGFGIFALPDMILREEDLLEDLMGLAAKVGLESAPVIKPDSPFGAFRLCDIYDADIEKAAQAAYSRDYMVFGFDNWKPV